MTRLLIALADDDGGDGCDPASLTSNFHSAGVMPWSCMSAQIHREQTPIDETQTDTMGLLRLRRRATSG